MAASIVVALWGLAAPPLGDVAAGVLLWVALAAIHWPPPLAATLAQAAPPNSITPYAALLSSGTTGAFALLFVADKIAPTRERNELRAELRQRNEEDRKILIPALVRNTEALTRVVQAQGGPPRGASYEEDRR